MQKSTMDHQRDNLEKTYKARDEVWRKVGEIDKDVLAYAVNPSFMGAPRWPDLRQSYRVIHLENGHTIIATDGLSDPFMEGHQLYNPDVNGFGVELYLEITEPFSMNHAGSTWWLNLLIQEALQVAWEGNMLGLLDKYDGLTSTELYDIPDLPADRKVDGERTPVLIGVPSDIVPASIDGPLSSIRFVSVTLLTLDELDFIIEKGGEARKIIAGKLYETYHTSISALDRPSVLKAK